jgi:hypothetical protein
LVRVSTIRYLLFEVIAAIDTGTVPLLMTEMKKLMEDEEVIDYLEGFKPKVVDLSLLKPDDRLYFNRNLKDMALAMHQRERRKFGIENDGLCLLAAYLLELLQRSGVKQDAWDVINEESV